MAGTEYMNILSTQSADLIAFDTMFHIVISSSVATSAFTEFSTAIRDAWVVHSEGNFHKITIADVY